MQKEACREEGSNINTVLENTVRKERLVKGV
jgi:hypothetical protein